jgi:hypothetical protein
VFPLPYADNFNKYPESQEAAYFSDQIGTFEIHTDAAAPANKLMRQMVPQLLIGWSDKGSFGPVTVIGMREWQDLTMQVGGGKGEEYERKLKKKGICCLGNERSVYSLAFFCTHV